VKEIPNGADLVVNMGCSVEVVYPRPMLAKMQKKLIDSKLGDPRGKPNEDVRRIGGALRGGCPLLPGRIRPVWRNTEY
jgi:hypothetical protein